MRAVVESPKELAEQLREASWGTAEDPEIVPVDPSTTSLGVVVVGSFEDGGKLENGNPPRFRRYGLVESNRVVATATVRLSEGGMDPVDQERRDVDGDGKPDLVFYYSRQDQWNPSTGLVAATQQGRLYSVPMAHARDGHSMYGSPCWATVGGIPVELVVWGEWTSDSDGNGTLLGYSASGYFFDDGAEQTRNVYGVVVGRAEKPDHAAELIPDADRPSDEYTVKVTDCSQRVPSFAVVPDAEHGFVVLTGLSFSKEHAGDDWPASMPKPKPNFPTSAVLAQRATPCPTILPKAPR